MNKFEKQNNPNKQGDMGMGLAISYFTLKGWTVCLPLTDSQSYDLVVDDGINLNKVFIRTSTRKVESGGYEVNLRSQGGNFTRKNKTKLFDKSKCDLVFVACSDGRQYLIPSDKINSKSTISVGGKTYNTFLIAS